MTVAELIKGFIAALLSRCPKCWEPLDCIRDWSGGVEGYGLYYCPKCDKIDQLWQQRNS